MNNMRRQTLRMADGGMLSGIKRTLGMAPPETVTQKFARQDAERAAKAAKNAPPPAPTPAPVPGAGISGYSGNGALEGRMKAAGLRDGGTPYHKGSMDGGRVVGPGTTISDSVPARYSKDEYVLPADTAKAIGHDNLDAIKNATHVPAAIQRGHSLRGRGGQRGQREILMADGNIPGIDVTERPWNHAQDTRRFAPQLPGIQVNEAPMSADQARTFNQPGEAAHGERVSPRPGPDGRYGAPPSPPTSEGPARAPAATSKPSLRAGVGAQTGALGKVTYAGGRALSGAAKVVGALGPAGYGADVVSHFNDYKINDPDVDSSARGTWNALRSGDFSGAGRSLSKGALETGMDLGSVLANTADYVVPGKAPVSRAYDQMLRSQFGDQLVPHTDVTAQLAAEGPPKSPPSRDEATTPASTGSAGDATMPGQDPGRNTLRGMAGTDVIGAPGVNKFVQNGKTLYSNVPGADNDKLMSNNPGVSTVPGMSRAQIDQTLTNPDGSRWSAGDNAIMAANLRDGADAYRGTSRDERNNPDFQLGQLAASPLGTPGRAFAQKQLGLRMADSTTRRGQDMEYEGRQQAAEAAQSTSRAEQQNKDRTYELDVQKFGVEVANKSRDDKRAGEAAFDDRVSGFVGTDKDGKPDARAASAVRNASNVFLADKQAKAEAALKKDPGNKRAAAILDDILTNGVGGIDDATLRTILLGQKANTVAQEYDGWSINPWAGKATNTQAPVTSLTLQDNAILPNQYMTDNGQLIPRRAVEDNPDLQKFIRLRQQ